MSVSRNFLAFLMGAAALIIIAVTAVALNTIDPTPQGLVTVSLLSHIYYITWFGLLIAMGLTIEAWRQGENKLFAALNLATLAATFVVNSELLIHVMSGRFA